MCEVCIAESAIGQPKGTLVKGFVLKAIGKPEGKAKYWIMNYLGMKPYGNFKLYPKRASAWHKTDDLATEIARMGLCYAERAVMPKQRLYLRQRWDKRKGDGNGKRAP